MTRVMPLAKYCGTRLLWTVWCGLALLAWCVPAQAAPVPVTILYTTDTHGHILSEDKTVGLDQIAAVRKQSPDAVLVDSGDFLHGTPLAGIDKGQSVVALMCESGYFAAAAGNHEFSHSLDALLQRKAEGKACASPLHILSANVYRNDGTPLLEQWAKTDIHGISLCFFGLTTPETKTQASPSAVSGLTFAPIKETAAATERAMRASGCDLVVALTHIGSDSQVPFTSLDLAAALPGLDAVIDGHSHRRFASIKPGKPPVVSSGCHGEALGKLTVSVDPDTRKITGVTNTFLTPADLAGSTPDKSVAAKLAALRRTVDAVLREVVATLPVSLQGDRALTRTRETALGDFTADAFRAAYGTDIAIVNAGSIREGLPAGPVTRERVAAAFPFDGYVVSLAITGSELHDILEHAVGKLPGEDGGFPQVSGLSFAFSPSSPPGNRIREITVAGRAVDKNTLYTLATNDFLAQGGDGYPHLAGKPRLQTWLPVTTAVINRLNGSEPPGAATKGRIRQIR